ncbi:membrane protein [Streptomyces olivoverticillatus]|uniref:Membrane protein n=1 Tax=Streptomyces olivoverticillatus TaxID=66427 RepID=A0A7W7PKJ4_9ACTN|nr:YhjD/YihY/BrkB family envelope integrity protein [Streptomyces olivoverticillatus]MBB4893297.1 membrane protein [Streptomyces olivoverticillatus]
MTGRRGRRFPHPVRGHRPAGWTTLDRKRHEAAERLGSGQVGALWNRLTAIDFFGNSFQLAALAILCFFPLLIVITTSADRSTATVVAGWLGLDQQAAKALGTLFKPGGNSGTITVTSVILLVLGAMAVAGTLQNWYQKVFAVPSPGWERAVVARLAWLASLFAYSAMHAVTGRLLGKAGSPVLQGLSGLVLSTLFWWWSAGVLLVHAVPWRRLFPAALVTGLCWMGLGVFSAFYFSAAIVSNEQRYGPIGVVMVILSWVVAVGVVIHLGSVIGCLYLERHPARQARRRAGRAPGWVTRRFRRR